MELDVEDSKGVQVVKPQTSKDIHRKQLPIVAYGLMEQVSRIGETSAQAARQDCGAFFQPAKLSRGARKSTANTLINHTIWIQRKV